MSRLISSCFVLAFFASVSLAQSPDVTNTSTSTAGKINCWTSRVNNRAIALHVYTDGLDKKVNLRQYELHPANIFLMKDTVLTIGGTSLPAKAVIDCKLSPVPSMSGGFNIDYTHNGAVHTIGWIRYIPGNANRSTGDVVVRFKRGATSIPSVAAAMGMTAIGSGCDEPPADDVGEEEQIEALSTDSRVPAGFLSKIPSVAAAATITNPSTPSSSTATEIP